jgi:16S rRNA (cytosine1402-N4)-methyltransferase
MRNLHESVLYDEVMEGLSVAPEDVVVDGTVGGAGHFKGLLASLSSDGVIIGIDEDAGAIERAREVVSRDLRPDRPVVHLVEDNFRHLGRILERLSVPTIDKALFDLGWSGYQLHEGRGFSFQGDEPLLMTYGNPEAHGTAAELINTLPEEELAKLIYVYGEERFARQIAKAIVRARQHNRIISTAELVDVIRGAVPQGYRNGRLNPATKTFQALRIATNDELGAIEDGLAAAIKHLSIGGRIAVITFHSIEDRIVKGIFRDAAAHGKGSVITKKVIAPSREEVRQNPRARSAKLRLFEGAGSGEAISPLAPVFSYA